MTWAVVQTRWDGVKWAFVGEVFHTFFKRRATKRARQLQRAHNRSRQVGGDRYRFTITRTS